MMFDAIIIGGGPAGSVAAALLARDGWSVTLVERAVFPRRKVCGEFISATTMPLLSELSIAHEFTNLAGPEVRKVGLFAGGSVVDAPMPRAGALDAAWGRALGREYLDALLLDTASQAGVTIWQPWKAVDLARAEGAFRVTVSRQHSAREIEGAVVIACNGAWEPGPFPWEPARNHHPSDLFAFKAHFVDCDLSSELMPLLVFPGGYGGMVRTDSDRVSISCCVRRDALTRIRRTYRGLPATRAVLSHIASTTAGVSDVLKKARLQDKALSAGPIRPGIRKRYERGIFMAGNAAGEAHPIIAEGISMAMQSSWLLARTLRERRDVRLEHRHIETIGRKYSAAWRRSFAPRIHAANLFAKAALHAPIASVVETFAGRFPRLLTLGAQLSGKTTNLTAVECFEKSQHVHP